MRSKICFRVPAVVLVLVVGAFLPGCKTDGPGALARLLDGDDGIVISAINPGTPAAPSGLWATAISATRADLGWTDNSTNEAGFKVYLRRGAGSWVLGATLAANTTSFSATGLKPGKKYAFKVVAFNPAGKTVSNIAVAVTYALLPISAPSTLVAWSETLTTINLAWSDGSNNETGFKIERKTGVYGSWSQIATTGENVITSTATGLTPSTTYYFRVRAYNGAGNSSFSVEASATTAADLVPPSKVTVIPTAVNAARVDLAWTAATDNYQVGGYQVFRDDTRLGSTVPATRVWSDGGVPSPAIDYSYVVQSQDTSLNSTPSDPVWVHTAGLSINFPVASSSHRVLGLAAASDNVNFLAGLTGDTVSDASENALLLNPRARRQAPLLHLGGTGGVPSVAWNGYHYLVMWPDDGGTTVELKGQLVGATGDTVGAPFTIASGIDGRSLAAGGGKYLATYTVEEPVGSGRGRLWSRFISDGGTVSAPMAVTGDTVSSSLSFQASSFNGFSFLTVFVPVKAAEGYATTKVAGRLIALDGALGAQMAIDSDTEPSGDPSVGYGNGQFLVVWTDLVSAGNDDVYSRTVSQAGTVGGIFVVSTAAGRQIYPGVASDGANFLVSYVDAVNDLDDDQVCDPGESTCWDLKAQKVTSAGALSGPALTVAAQADNQIGMPVFGAGRYFFLISNGSSFGGGGTGTATGRFLTP